jgi:hypothetical protein
MERVQRLISVTYNCAESPQVRSTVATRTLLLALHAEEVRYARDTNLCQYLGVERLQRYGVRCD